jgi:hypothetical protein
MEAGNPTNARKHGWEECDLPFDLFCIISFPKLVRGKLSTFTDNAA